MWSTSRDAQWGHHDVVRLWTPFKEPDGCCVRCTFDGNELKIAQVGPALENRVGRGLLEPSVARFGERFYMTIRAEDGRGYVAQSDDGVRYRRMTAWAWDDGTPIGMSTTQQHWLSHSDGLFLVYTRKDGIE